MQSNLNSLKSEPSRRGRHVKVKHTVRFYAVHLVTSRQKRTRKMSRRTPPWPPLQTAEATLSSLIAGQIGEQRLAVSRQLILALMRPVLTAVKLEAHRRLQQSKYYDPPPHQSANGRRPPPV